MSPAVELYDVERAEDLKGVYETVAAELGTIYSVAYAPSNPSFDGKFRRIKVKVNKPDDAVARTRYGYFAK